MKATNEGERQVSREAVQQNVLRAQEAIEQAQEAIERARVICGAAWIVRMKARSEREKARRPRSPEAARPAREFWLPPLDVALAYLDRGLPPIADEPAAPGQRWGARRERLTVLYAWGYGRSRPSILRMQFRETEAACRFAAERGWDRRRPGAWAGEQPFAVGLHAALRTVEPLLHADPCVAGWGGKLVRPD